MNDQFPRFAPFSDRDIERYLVDELDDERASELEEAAKKDSALAAHLEERRAEKRAFDQLHPTPAFLEEKPKRRARAWHLVPALVALALVPAIALLDDDDVHVRGVIDANAELVVKRDARLFVLDTPDVLLRERDALRIDLQLDGERTLLIALKSGNSAPVTLLTTRVTGPTWRQPSSFVLDDARGKETLTVVLFEDPALAPEIERAIRSGAALDAAHWTKEWTWEKEPLP